MGKRILPRLAAILALSLGSCDRGTAPEPTNDLVLGDDASLQSVVSGIQSDLSAMRNLPFHEPVVSRWVKRGHLLALMDSIDASFGPSQADTSQGPHPTETEILVGLDLLEANSSAEEEQRAFDGANIAGFYITGTNRFWLVENPSQPDETNHSIIAHELAHALQDQNFPDKYWHASGYDERQAMYQLVEGEAEYLGSLWSLRPGTIEAFEASYNRLTVDAALQLAPAQFPTAPLALSFPVFCHYLVGEWSIHDQRKALGWSSIDQLHRQHPLSAKRMLHPFAGADALDIVEWPDEVFASHPGLVPLGSDRLGEVYLAAMLHWRAPDRPWNASTWTGDRFWLWRAGDSLHHIAAGRIHFETEEGAKQFLSKWAAGRGMTQSGGANPDSLEASRGDTGLARGVRHGRQVSLLYGSHPGTWPTSVADSLWSELGQAQPNSVASARRAANARASSKVPFPPFPTPPVRIRKEYLPSQP